MNQLETDLIDRIEELQNELNEQARLLGMSAERELALQTQIQKLISERNAFGLAIDRALTGIVPDEHPLRSRLVEIAAMRAQTAPGVLDGWQPIETAPKDGTHVLLANKSGTRVADGMYGNYKVWSWPYVMVEPAYWRPMPAAPNAQENKDE